MCVETLTVSGQQHTSWLQGARCKGLPCDQFGTYCKPRPAHQLRPAARRTLLLRCCWATLISTTTLRTPGALPCRVWTERSHPQHGTPSLLGLDRTGSNSRRDPNISVYSDNIFRMRCPAFVRSDAPHQQPSVSQQQCNACCSVCLLKH
jgi:hypothetical protein